MEKQRTVKLQDVIVVIPGVIPKTPGELHDFMKNMSIRELEAGTEVTIRVETIIEAMKMVSISCSVTVAGETQPLTWGTDPQSFQKATGFAHTELELPEPVVLDFNKLQESRVVTVDGNGKVIDGGPRLGSPPKSTVKWSTVAILSIAAAAVGFLIAISGSL